jgi:formylglycine-generating enzyme
MKGLIHIPAVFLLIMSVLIAAPVPAQQKQQAPVLPSGSFHSVLPEVEGEPVEVKAFRMDKHAITNREYAEFLVENPEWRRSEIPGLYTGPGYLRHWIDDLGFAEGADHQPVTRVSWFAANAYCDWVGGRLPTLNEWEYAAQAMDFESPDEADRFSHDLIGWYSAVDAKNPEDVSGSGIKNRYGHEDLFGLIMEWVEDFRPPVGSDISMDCGTVGRMKGDSTIYSYAMSIRYLTRMSFSPQSTTGMLGFRCAYNVENPKAVR